MTIYKLKQKKVKPRKEVNEFGTISDFDENNNEIHIKYSDGQEYWYDEENNEITEEEFNKIWEKVE